MDEQNDSFVIYLMLYKLTVKYFYIQHHNQLSISKVMKRLPKNVPYNSYEPFVLLLVVVLLKWLHVNYHM